MTCLQILSLASVRLMMWLFFFFASIFLKKICINIKTGKITKNTRTQGYTEIPKRMNSTLSCAAHFGYGVVFFHPGPHDSRTLLE